MSELIIIIEETSQNMEVVVSEITSCVNVIVGEESNPEETIVLDNRVIVKQASDFGTIDSTKEYFLDGVIDMGSTSIEVPVGGLYISGYNFDVSGLVSTEDNYTLFTSPVGGSGNVLLSDFYVDVSGASSQVYDLSSNTGFGAIEVSRINWNNCTSLGTIFNYRQGLESGTGRFGGTPELTLDGEWVGGYFIDTCIVRGLSDGNYSLYKAGGTFTMASRFRTNQNVDLNASVSFFDFSPANIINTSTLQLTGCIITRNGVLDSTDTNITPNIDATDPKSIWKDNIGIHNTFVGGTLTVSSEVATEISTQGTFVDLAGTFDTSSLSHFDSPANGQLRHLGDTPRDYNVFITGTFDSVANDDIRVKIVVWDDSASTFVDYKSVQKVVNNLSGGRDVAFYSFPARVVLDLNDYVKIQVANMSNPNDITAELTTEINIGGRS